MVVYFREKLSANLSDPHLKRIHINTHFWLNQIKSDTNVQPICIDEYRGVNSTAHKFFVKDFNISEIKYQSHRYLQYK